MNTPKGSANSHIRNIFYAIVMLTVATIAANFSHDVHSQTTSNHNDKELREEDNERIIQEAVRTSILETKTFPIFIKYPQRELLLAKGYLLWEKISFDPTEQALVLTNNTHEKKLLFLRPELPFIADGGLLGDITIEKLTINSIGYGHRGNNGMMEDKFHMDISCDPQNILLPIIEKRIGLKKHRIHEAVLPVIIRTANGHTTTPKRWKMQLPSSNNGTHTMTLYIFSQKPKV